MSDAVQKRGSTPLATVLMKPAVTIALVYIVTIVIAGFLPEAHRLQSLTASAALFTGILSWVFAIYIWSYRRTETLLSLAVLFLLVLLGFLWGWAYILAAAANKRRLSGYQECRPE